MYVFKKDNRTTPIENLKEGKSKSWRSVFFASNNYHIPSYEDMKKFHTDEELENTIRIADMCEQYNILGVPNPPEFKSPIRI